jgi:endonuclease/exonuclease/phosphatase family metal-dependent hydrolase
VLELPKPPRRPRGLRVMSFNVHFWQRGYSSRLHGDNQEACVEAVRRHQPDVLLLQEVVPADVAAGGAYDALSALARLGYIHRVMVAAPEVHAHRMRTACAPHAHRMRTACAPRRMHADMDAHWV